MRTFAEDLEFFVNSIDFIEDDFFKDVMNLIKRYVNARWGIELVSIMQYTTIEQKKRDGKVSEVSLLEKFSLENRNSNKIYWDTDAVEKRAIKEQMPFIVTQKKPAWIVCEDKKTLKDCKEGKYKDLWSGIEDIPKYARPQKEMNTRTSIIIPFFKKKYLPSDKKDMLGVVNFESSKYLNADAESKKELKLLTEVIKEMLYLNYLYHRNHFNTSLAIEKLEDRLFNNLYYKPEDKIFLAYPKNCDREVINLIKKTIEEENEHLELNVEIVDWEAIEGTEYITPRLFEKIYDCKYGICYLSELNEDSTPRFKDNSNVLIEAAFMHSKFHNARGRRPKWILIREEDSPPMTFDFKDIRRVVIERKNEKIKEEEFKKDLTGFLEKMYLE